MEWNGGGGLGRMRIIWDYRACVDALALCF